MATIFITTELIAPNEYEFVQTLAVGEMNVEERVLVESHNDRMYAAMTNLGKACRWLYDLNIRRGTVCITTDKDGSDVRYKGEHDDLFRAIHSQHDYIDNRIKYELFYGGHVKFLDRIRELANEQEIAFTQKEKPDNTIKVQKAEVFNSYDPFLIRNRKWNKENLLKITLTGSQNKVQCVACQAFILYAQTDNFVPVEVVRVNSKGSKAIKKIVRSNKEYVKWFLETHLQMHMPIEVS